MTVHEMTTRVLYAHTDKAGVVYYANYLQFFEMGRTEYFRALGRSYADFERLGVLLTVVDAHLRYLGPATYDDVITIRTWVTRIRRTRIDFAYEILDPAAQPICRGSTTLGCIDATSYRPRPLPEEMISLLDGATVMTDASPSA